MSELELMSEAELRQIQNYISEDRDKEISCTRTHKNLQNSIL